MAAIESLDLPAETLRALQAAGLMTVEQLCNKLVSELAVIEGIAGNSGLERIREIRAALAKLGLDLRKIHEDPIGWPTFPSRQALRRLFDYLDLMPETRKRFTQFLLGAILPEEMLAQSDLADHATITRLLELFDR